MELLDQCGNVIKAIEDRNAPPDLGGHTLSLKLYFARQFAPTQIVTDERSERETVRLGNLRLLPLPGRVQLSSEEARDVERDVPGTVGLFLEAIENDGETERARWFLVTRLVSLGVARQQTSTEEVTK